ncbi:hypothetical protein [Providencia sp. PROV039]|uniref:tail fiber/spike domain-containing protein n=1 Tax=Providencia sp. PROV039 TaxID=2949770 RepID=UPI002348FF15|nr:hypothetical protein [Providencia sp. PROV039]
MREVKPTQKPVPSSDVKDLFFNSEKIDEWVNSLQHEYTDRFGKCHKTAAGIEWVFSQLVERFKIESEQALLAAGYAPVGTFQEGAEVVSRNGTVLWKLPDGDGDHYRWDGDLPKLVPTGSTPQSTGGIGKGAWVSVGDASLRGDLARESGANRVGYLSSTVYDRLSEVVSLTDFSDNPKSEVDWTPVMQKACNWLEAVGGGVLEIPRGVFIFKKPQADIGRFISTGSNIIIRGQGKNTVLKVEDNAGDFQQFISSKTNGTYVENVTIRDLCIDSNILNNTSSNVTTSINAIQYLICYRRFKNVVVDSCYLKGGGRNTILLASYDMSSDDATVSNCKFEFDIREEQDFFDATHVYFNCKNHKLFNNTFNGKYKSRDINAAWEMHGGPGVAMGNTVNGIKTGTHITADSAAFADGKLNSIIVIANNFNAVSRGVFVWSFQDGARGFNISDNTITVKQSAYNQSYDTGISIWRFSDSRSPYRDITIDNNIIEFEKTDNTKSFTGLDRIKTTGIGLVGEADMTDITVTNNTVINAPISGISAVRYNDKKLSGITIKDNNIIDAGEHFNVDQPSFRAGIYLNGLGDDSDVSGNKITYSSANKGLYGIYSATETDAVTYESNRVSKNYANNIQGVSRARISHQANTNKIGTYFVGDILFSNRGTETGWRCTSSGTRSSLTDANLTVTPDRVDGLIKAVPITEIEKGYVSINSAECEIVGVYSDHCLIRVISGNILSGGATAIYKQPAFTAM